VAAGLAAVTMDLITRELAPSKIKVVNVENTADG
jgi:hypothetical protein